MESIVYQNSPFAAYLEGQGEHEEDSAALEVDKHTPLETASFAPRGPPTIRTRVRDKFPVPLRLQVPEYSSALAQLHDACSSAVHARIGRSENDRFLEQFRYTIVASQLLNEHAISSYHPLTGSLSTTDQTADTFSSPQSSNFGVGGAVLTAAASFSTVWVFHWVRSQNASYWDGQRICVAFTLLATVAATFYIYARRQWLEYIRHQALRSAASLVSNAQLFDSAASAAITLIQEVELVSRGYRISSPMPPISRLDEQSQSRRCLRLRRYLSAYLTSILTQYVEAYHTLGPLGQVADLEKYYDIYEISRIDIQQVELGNPETELEDRESVKSLKIFLTGLHTARKVTLCCLLALGADGGKADFKRWALAVEEIQRLVDVTATGARRLAVILDEEECGPSIASSKEPATPGKERVRAQFRRLNSLSQGVRALQAKIHVLREESDAGCAKSNDDTTLNASLITHYESIGSDLRVLLQEWEAGKKTLALDFENSDQRASRSSSGLRSPMSPAHSLGGITAVGESPSDALRVLNGEDVPRSGIDAAVSDEEIFEAISQPLKRSSMTRVERIAKMKEDRIRQAAAREKADASTHMLKELETVIKLWPRGRTTSRIPTL